MPSYTYLICYTAIDKQGRTCIGNIHVDIDQDLLVYSGIDAHNPVRELEEILALTKSFTVVTITNIIVTKKKQDA